MRPVWSRNRVPRRLTPGGRLQSLRSFRPTFARSCRLLAQTSCPGFRFGNPGPLAEMQPKPRAAIPGRSKATKHHRGIPMPRRRRDVYQQQRELRSSSYSNARILGEEYPDVEEIVIELTFFDPDEMDPPDSQRKILIPSQRSYFEITCPFRECINGGFNLTSVVSTLISDRRREELGTSYCQGWQDQERVNKHRCLLKLQYCIAVRYRGN
jgi:hypothetical protein